MTAIPTFLRAMPGPRRTLGAGAESLRHPVAMMLAAAAAALLCGLIVHPAGLIWAAALAAVVGAGLGWPRAALLGVQATVHADRNRVTEGQPVRLTLRLTRRSLVPLIGARLVVPVRRGWSDEPGQTLVIALPILLRAGTRELTVTLPPAERGVLAEGEGLAIVCDFPLAASGATRPVQMAQPVVVWPKPTPSTLDQWDGGVSDRAGLTPVDRPGAGSDPLGSRPFRAGDRMRQIHWGLSAKRDELVTIERSCETATDVLVELDLDLAHYGGDAEAALARREDAIRLAAGLVEAALAGGRPAMLHVRDGVSRACRGLAEAPRALDALAMLERARPGEPKRPPHGAGLHLVVTSTLGRHKLVDTVTGCRGCLRWALLDGGTTDTADRVAA